MLSQGTEAYDQTPTPDSTIPLFWGLFSIGTKCDRLVNLACIAILRDTWCFNDGSTKPENEHILVGARWTILVRDCWMYRGAESDSARGSDHCTERIVIRLHLQAIPRTIPPAKAFRHLETEDGGWNRFRVAF